MAHLPLSLAQELEWRVDEYGRSEPVHLAIILAEYLEDLFEPTGRYAVLLQNGLTFEPIEQILQDVIEDSAPEELLLNLDLVAQNLLSSSPVHTVYVGPRAWTPESASLFADHAHEL